MSKIIKFPPIKEYSEFNRKVNEIKLIIDYLVKRDCDIHLVVNSEDKAVNELLDLQEAQAGNKLYPKVVFTTNLEEARELLTRSFWVLVDGNL